jgi:hypothetical protein
MSAYPISLTLAGVPQSGIKLPVGASITFSLTCQDPTTRNAIAFTGSDSLKLNVFALDFRGNPTQPPTIARAATGLTIGGLATVQLAPADTIGLDTTFQYGINIVWTDASGNLLPLLPFTVTPLVY